MQVFWVKLKDKLNNASLSLEQLAKLMKRCLKLYSIIDAMIKLFKLIWQKEVSDQLTFSENRQTQRIEAQRVGDGRRREQGRVTKNERTRLNSCEEDRSGS
jgi:hypothetical protein